MVRKVVVQLIDGIPGKEAKETVTVALDGVENYEVDLTDVHAAELRE
jgi:hypothetical protein